MIPHPFGFAGRVALVTGGGTGIGAATAKLLARYGADVAIASRRSAPLEETAATIRGETGRRCIAIPTDVRDEDQVKALIERTVGELGRIDILVNNAGGAGGLAPVADLTTEHWHKSFALNVNSAYFCTREAGKHFIAQGSGAIVNVSSLAGVHGTKGAAHYSSSKAALQMFTRVTAAEWGRFGIRINCVAPGMIATELARKIWDKSKLDIASATKIFPLRRAGTPEEVANAIVFLASDAASYITGEILTVGGGPQLGGPPEV